MKATIEFVNGTTEELTILADDYKHLASGVSVRSPEGARQVISADSIASLTTARDGLFRQVDFVNRSPGIPREVIKKLARQLVEGEASLYRLDLLPGEKFSFRVNKDGGLHTYYVESDDTFTELRQEESVKKGVEYRKDDRYLGALAFLMQSCEQVTARLEYEKIAYTDADLAQLVRQYNACGNDIPVATDSDPEKTRAYEFEGLYARAGGLKEKRFQNLPASDAAFGGLVVGLRAPRISRRTSINLGVDYYKNSDTIAFDRRNVVSPVLSAIRVNVYVEQEVIDPRYLVRPFMMAGFVYENSDSYGFENNNIIKYQFGVGVKTDFLKLTVFNESIKQWNATVTVRLWPVPWRGREREE